MSKIIVEVCQNHSGDTALLEEMIEQAAANGADIVKMQTMYSADLTKRERFEKGEVDADGNQTVIQRPYQDEFDRLSKLDLVHADHELFIELCTKHGVIPMTTVFGRNRVAEVGALNWPERIVKVASYDCASWPMLRELAEHFDRFIISTGAMYDEEIEKTAALMKELGKDFTFLHCVTSYPNTVDMSHLSRMNWLRTMTDTVGWSDHSLVERDGVNIAKVAFMLGADYVERHFTTQASTDTKDGPISINPEQLKELSDFRNLSKEEQKAHVEEHIPNWEEILGSEKREMTQTELLNRDYYRGRFASPKENQTGPEEDQWVYNWED